MIINSTLKQPFCQRVEYEHDTGILKTNPQTQRFCKKFKDSIRIRKVSSTSSMVKNRSKSTQNFNKYYIEPQMRYSVKKNPNQSSHKQLATINNDEMYIYKNLHNKDFWDEKQPFKKRKKILATNKAQQQSNVSRINVNLKILQQFKNHVQGSSTRRLPLVIRSALANKL